MSPSAGAATGIEPEIRPSTGTPTEAESREASPSTGHSPWVGWLAIVAVLVWLAVEAVRIIAQPAHEVVFGDYAMFELAARQAWHFRQLLGPYAHPGFNNPGPALFYLLAAPVRLLEPGPGLYLGAVVINGAAFVATVVFVWRRAGTQAALWSAAVLDLFCLAIGLDTLRQPWNPLLIVAPMVLFVVLCAGAVTRVGGAWLWAAVIGSYELQTHITTSLFVVIMMVGSGIWALAGRGRRASPRPPPGWWRQPARVTGLGALVLIWLPSTLELFLDHPNNFNRAWLWVAHGRHPGIAPRTAFGIVLRSVAISPFNHRVWAAPVPASRIEEAAAVLILGAGGVLIGWLVRRRQVFAAVLAGAPMVAFPLATFTVSHAGEDNYAFLTAWLGFVPCVLLLALGFGLLTAPPVLFDPPQAQPVVGRRTPFALHLTALLGVVAVVCASATVVSDLRQTSVASINTALARVTSFVPDAEAQLRPGDHWVGFVIASSDDWGLVAGVVLELERLGYHVVVDHRFGHLFGESRTVPHPLQVVFSFYLLNDHAGARLALGSPVTTSAGSVMTVWRPPG